MARSAQRNGIPYSLSELRKMMGVGRMYDFLAPHAFPDKQFFFDDFHGDTINLDNWAVANSAGTGAADFAFTAGRGGWVRGATGTTDDGSISMVGPATWYGDANADFMIRFKCDLATGVNIEVGLIDAVPSSNNGGVNDEDTPTLNAGDAALFSIDTDETYQKWGFYTKGSTSNFNAAKTASGLIAGTIGSSYTTGVHDADEFVNMRVALRGDRAYGWINGVLVAEHNEAKVSAGCVEGGVALRPWVYARTRNTTTHLLTVDFVALVQDRA
jgi:hypothetical protein